MTNKTTNIFRMMALGLSVAGGLLVCEVIRPFHDFSIDGPIALSFWGIGTALALVCFVLRARSLAFSTISRVANVVPSLGALIVWWLMSQSNFAWR